jgi:hypothetical protein
MGEGKSKSAPSSQPAATFISGSLEIETLPYQPLSAI